MMFYLAPMEGITGYLFRNAWHRQFGGADRYVTPFLSPTETKILNYRERADVLLEHNQGLEVIPQILTARADLFLKTSEELAQMGYQEVNLNLGCPSGTVVAKGRGAGLLAEPKKLELFLKEIFAACPIRISVKTRIGMETANEFTELLELFNQFPISMLMIHPRVQKQFYQGKPHLDSYQLAVEKSSNPICYNGDLCTRGDYESFLQRFTDEKQIMIGRGILKNPDLLNELRGNPQMSKIKLRQFHDDILDGYTDIFSGDRNVLFKMKELWFYLSSCFENPDKSLKKIRKAQKLAVYKEAVEEMFVRELSVQTKETESLQHHAP